MLEIARVSFTRRSAQGYSGDEDAVAGATAMLQPPDIDAVTAGLDEDGQELLSVVVTRSPSTSGIEVGDVMTMHTRRYEVKSVRREGQKLTVNAARIGRV